MKKKSLAEKGKKKTPISKSSAKKLSAAEMKKRKGGCRRSDYDPPPGMAGDG